MKKINQFIYNEKKSYDDMHLIITDTPSRVSPARRISSIDVSGRNGNILIDEGCFENGEVKYSVALIPGEFDMPLAVRKIRRWLQGDVGYFKLSDTYDPNYYYLACYTGILDIADKLGKLGETTLTFTTKPFRYRNDGENELVISAETTIFNPEDWESTPYIKIIGNGNITLSINNSSFGFTDVNEYIEIDGDIQSCYKGTTLQNSKTSFISFPKFCSGKNNISFVGNVTKIIILPRWCTL